MVEVVPEGNQHNVLHSMSCRVPYLIANETRVSKVSLRVDKRFLREVISSFDQRVLTALWKLRSPQHFVSLTFSVSNLQRNAQPHREGKCFQPSSSAFVRVVVVPEPNDSRSLQTKTLRCVVASWS
jgi:hypothetical protein